MANDLEGFNETHFNIRRTLLFLCTGPSTTDQLKFPNINPYVTDFDIDLRDDI